MNTATKSIARFMGGISVPMKGLERTISTTLAERLFGVTESVPSVFRSIGSLTFSVRRMSTGVSVMVRPAIETTH